MGGGFSDELLQATFSVGLKESSPPIHSVWKPW